MDEQPAENRDEEPDSKPEGKQIAYGREWFERNAERIKQETGNEITLDYEWDAAVMRDGYRNIAG